MRILIVDDDELLAQTLVSHLLAQHYAIDVATDGEAGWDYAQAATYDLIVLDVNLPKLNGIHLCQKLRQANYTNPILLLTAKGNSSDKVMGLDAGADDYVVKPCAFEELCARIRALLRRASSSGAPILEWGGLQLDPSTCVVSYYGQPISLSPKEYGLLELFLRNPQRIFSSSLILEHLWDFEDFPSEETVRTHIKRLRRRLKAVGAEDIVETVYGMGYRLKNSPSPSTSGTAAGGTAAGVTATSNAVAVTPADPVAEQALSEQARNLAQQAWERFKTPTLERLTILDQAVAAIQQGTLSGQLYEEAERAAHKLAGSLGMFGFDEGSRLGQQIETYLQQIHGLLTPDSSQHLGDRATLDLRQQLHTQLTDAVSQLHRELAQDHQTAGTSGGTGSSVGSPPVGSGGQMGTSAVGVPAAELSQRFPLFFSPPPLHPASGGSPVFVPPIPNPSVLVIDHDTLLVDQLKVMLRGSGVTLAVARSVADAKGQIAHQMPDVVLLDLGLTDRSDVGLELLTELGDRYPNLPILIFSVNDDFNDRLAAARRSKHRFISKSTPLDQVLDVIWDVLRRSQPLPLTVLAVDDDPLILDQLAQVLPRWGIQLITLTHSEQFWPTLETTTPDLLILDVEMPQVNGIELCQVVRSDNTWNDLPILFLSSRRDAETIHRIYNAGADDYVSKPFAEPELITRIFNRLERNHLLRSLTETDQLTGIANRRHATKQLNQHLQRSLQAKQPLSLAIIDLDRFKQINHQYGYETGDLVLKRVAQILRQMLRTDDIVGRWGGEEFLVGLYGVHREKAKERLTQFLSAVQRDICLSPDGHSSFQVTVSVGVAEAPDDGCNLHSLYQIADIALQQAKAAGGNQIFACPIQA